ncbi:inositol monophosphatase [Aulographum hederae CBS 113979]|uniref:Inositol-1-monophosphatase n=1 Tax=Aulographum hederae CBS 113979 TaxID=1176131 RepID=A0A6G1H1T7_9PEZI|nr:inositol monophosphatase [Aulographum hederae CBS 113979]
MPSMQPEELDDLYEFAIQLGKDAGRMLLEAAEKRWSGDGMINDYGEGEGGKEHVQKMNSVDLVTKTDEDVERFVKNQILTKYPSHEFIGEESYAKGGSKEYLIKDGPTWCVDPLDGTVNYIHLFPLYCVSIAFLLNGTPIIGIINAPFLSQLFTARSNHGAYLTTATSRHRLPLIRNPIPPLPPNAPTGCIFACEWGKDRRDRPDGNMQRKVETFLDMAAEVGGRGGRGGMVHGIRSLGSATMDLAYTALGSVDVWWEGGCWEWDVAAGICILQEAGGLITHGTPPEDFENAKIESVDLGSRLYLGIRPAGPSADESAREIQERTVREVWRRVRGLDYKRP